MRALEDTIAALGQPVFVRALGAPSEPTAAIARWRHGPSSRESSRSFSTADHTNTMGACKRSPRRPARAASSFSEDGSVTRVE